MRPSKLFGLSLAFIAAAGAFAAGQNESAAQEQIVLNLWHIHTPETRKVPIENAARRFEAANPGVKVIVSVYENDPYKTKIKTVSGAEFPDVFHTWGGGWLKSFVDAGLVADITKDAKAWEDKLNPAALNFNKFDGKLYGSPYLNASTILYYNKALFDKYGLKFPATYSELLSVCKTFKDNGVIPFALGNKSKWPGAQHFVLLSMRLGGPDIFQQAIDKKVKFTDPSFIKAGEMLQDLVNKGYFPSGVNGINYDTGGSRMMFYTEQCAMIVQTSGFMSACKSENPEFYAKKLGIGLYPAVEGGKGKATDLLSGENAFSVAASSKHKEMAAKLVGFLSTDPQLQKEFVAGGSLGAMIGIDTDAPQLKAALEQIKNATFLQNFIDQTLSPEMANVHKDTVQALFGGTMTPQQAAEEMQRSFEAAK